MAIAPSVLKIVKDYEQTCIAIDDPQINLAAKFVAYYSAMINAAEDDPMEDAAEQAEMLEHLNHELKHHVEIYQQMINEKV